jgi:DnaK suppressor protein
MNKHEDIAKTLKARLSELTSRVAEIDNELRKPLSADSEDQATDLENQDALGGIEHSGLQEIRQIKGARADRERYLRRVRPMRRRY